MKFIFGLFAAIAISMIAFLMSLQNGKFLAYLDTHPHPKVVPPVEYYVGAGYSMVGNLQDSVTYYMRVVDRYPRSPYADDAYYSYVESLEGMNVPGPTLAGACTTYMELFPEGIHTEVVKKKLEYASNRR